MIALESQMSIPATFEPIIDAEFLKTTVEKKRQIMEESDASNRGANTLENRLLEEQITEYTHIQPNVQKVIHVFIEHVRQERELLFSNEMELDLRSYSQHSIGDLKLARSMALDQVISIVLSHICSVFSL